MNMLKTGLIMALSVLILAPGCKKQVRNIQAADSAVHTDNNTQEKQERTIGIKLKSIGWRAVAIFSGLGAAYSAAGVVVSSVCFGMLHTITLGAIPCVAGLSVLAYKSKQYADASEERFRKLPKIKKPLKKTLESSVIKGKKTA